MRIDQAFPSNYLKASELNGRSFILTMSNIAVEDVGDGHKPVLYFQGADKGLVINKTNALTLEAMYGPETDNWMGQRIEVYPDKTMFQGRRVDCIRVRRPAGVAEKAEALAATMPPAEPQAPIETGPGPAPAPGSPDQYDDSDIPF